MDADGGSQTQLTFDPVFKDQTPDWSPDGSKLSFAAGVPGRHPRHRRGRERPARRRRWPHGRLWDLVVAGRAFIAFLGFDDRDNRYVDLGDGSVHVVSAVELQSVPAWQPRGDRLS